MLIGPWRMGKVVGGGGEGGIGVGIAADGGKAGIR